jgi:hypothetical protein
MPKFFRRPNTGSQDLGREVTVAAETVIASNQSLSASA